MLFTRKDDGVTRSYRGRLLSRLGPSCAGNNSTLDFCLYYFISRKCIEDYNGELDEFRWKKSADLWLMR
jgi:hypothetical protein